MEAHVFRKKEFAPHGFTDRVFNMMLLLLHIILNVLVHKIVEDLGVDIEKLRGEGSLRVPKA